ncbi:acyl-CoA dehydrogenase family protein [Rhodococcus opacus]|uniref:acyl-CoA dehydrogenase family protein n=1 Tax=Rhodococcus opacus TaxID=37919 RepID=UPI0002A32827|nr:acyl-CoA dehydrogenase family protein [Rhodococcus opacus]ELB91662.1 acyl-CoA dehydrogenase [Rhodococcus wratislaviensis IFP 2016]MDX5968975.1 acyl-CoA dehydrogenase family protein [Rhodococcus opacus]NKY72161.1 acyl-CoA/acyl-ACP dehydrogenase [Rhodococcus opacus]CAG7591190.1 Acyl-CoA dehydrogenase FadE28 [Rhodococcus opacus]
MDFTRDETQEAVAQVAAGLLARDLDGDALWAAFADADLLTLALPERLGGEGLSVTDVGALLTEVGRKAAQVPALATLGFGVLPIVALGDDAQQDALLTGLADGRTFTAALAEPGAQFPARPSVTAVADGDGYAVTGHVLAVPFAERAHRILVPTDTGVVLVDPGADGVTLTPTPSASGSPEFAIALDGARGELLAAGDDAVQTLYRTALASIGAVADGLLSGATVLAGEHLATRHQFGKPLATFQAVSQQIADVYVTSRTLHVSALAASWRVSEGLDAQDDLDVMAYWIAAEVPAAMQVLHHLHGGIGVDVTYPLHRYYSTAKDLARLVGGASYRLDLVGARCSSI